MTLTKKLSVLPLVVGLAMGGVAFAATTTHDTTHDTTAKATVHTMSLAAVTDPKDTLTKAKVEDTKGESVGTVDEVMMDKKGKPSSLKVDVGGFLGVGDRDVAMKASAFKFDPDRKVLITSMTKNQIKKLPAMKS
jgi:sporulation protein YlmC with PRC-barrel domain